MKEIRVLLVDDEPDVLEFLSYNLRKEGYSVSIASNGVEGLKKAKLEWPHLILLDIMMPDMDGVEMCHQIKVTPELKDILVVFLTARIEEYSQLAGFDAGADDYITKPIKPKILIKKINALLRRLHHEGDDSILKVGEVIIDKARHNVSFRGKDFILPKKEFKLLTLLASDPHRVFKREEILKKVWGTEVIVGDRTIDVHIRKLREKLGNDYLSTIKGIGYKINI